MGLLTWPEIQKSLVPEFLGRPKLANHSAPRLRMVGATATVSTLVTWWWWWWWCAFASSVIVSIAKGRGRGRLYGGGATEDANVGGERGLQPGLAGLALEALNERRLLTADVGTSTLKHARKREGGGTASDVCALAL